MRVEWTAARLRELKFLWDNGVPGKVIARKLGLRRAAIVYDRAYRMGLKPRFTKKKHDLRRADGKFTAGPKPEPARRAPDYINGRYAMSLGPPPKHCQWIEGEPSANDACKCGAPVLPEFSYCAEHVYRAYLQPTPKLQIKALMKVAA